ncbi:hypothetical protein [Devosia sp.]|uniref:hypothetical protein n=1 Tax=Devosia sp. TaxID=1871048 RepID=UPI00261AC050|nr:hypothetical protein [Devosia sp.]
MRTGWGLIEGQHRHIGEIEAATVQIDDDVRQVDPAALKDWLERISFFDHMTTPTDADFRRRTIANTSSRSGPPHEFGTRQGRRVCTGDVDFCARRRLG